MNYQKQIIRTIIGMSGHVSPYNIFSDWVEMSALAIQNACFINHNELWKRREDRYHTIISNYKAEDQRKFSEMFGVLSKAFEENIEDLLGGIYMGGECSSKYTGQFFTPFHISLMTADVGIPKDYDGSHVITCNESSCGSGSMVIANAAVLNKRGFDYRKLLKVVCQDLDWKCVFMSYVQLSLLGINAVVVQGDSLCDPYCKGYPAERTFRTPANMGMLV